MAGESEDNETYFDMSSWDFAHGPCAWCHPGGGALEYDRDGYRYDLGTNPDPKKGDYWSYNGTAWIDRTASWQSGGVAEADCLMCHLKTEKSGYRYVNEERNLAFVGPKKPKLAATLGLAGPLGVTGLISIPGKAANATMPDISSFTYGDIGAGYATLPGSLVQRVPDKENCALCHFADKSFTDLGPASLPLGFTTFQKYIPPGSVVDGDWDGDPNGMNREPWKVAKGRAEFGKRAESINDPANPDVHMDWADGNLTCSDCHFPLEGTYPALKDESGDTVYPEVEVLPIDHQFAKGNDKPDGKNMDQLDNTVTCEACHIQGAHPRITGVTADGDFIMERAKGGTVVVPVPTHTGLPSHHLVWIDCRACHIPELNFVKKQIAADYLVGPYRTGPRGQFLKAAQGENGIHYKPLYMWTKRAHTGGQSQIIPVATMVSAVWADGDPSRPTFQRLGAQAAKAVRAASTDSDGDGLLDFCLNHPQGTGSNKDVALIVNTPSEITAMVNQLKGLGVGDPKMVLYVNAFTVSHNVRPAAYALGAEAKGGCLSCHTSSDPSNPNYWPYSAGFFDKQHLMFNAPKDDGGTGSPGLRQTVIGGGRAVIYAFCDVNASLLGDGEEIPNYVDQSACLGMSTEDLAVALNPAYHGVPKPSAWFSWVQVVTSQAANTTEAALRADTNVTQRVILDASASVCPSGNCTYKWDFESDGVFDLNSTDPIVRHTFASAGDHNVTLLVVDNETLLRAVVRNMTWTYDPNVPGGGTAPEGGYEVVVDLHPGNTPPHASFELVGLTPEPDGSYVVHSGDTVTVQDTSSDDEGNLSGFTVHWGDEGVDEQGMWTAFESKGGPGSQVQHTYLNPGTYKIRFFAQDDGGLTAKADDVKLVVLP